MVTFAPKPPGHWPLSVYVTLQPVAARAGDAMKTDPLIAAAMPSDRARVRLRMAVPSMFVVSTNISQWSNPVNRTAVSPLDYGPARAAQRIAPERDDVDRYPDRGIGS